MTWKKVLTVNITLITFLLFFVGCARTKHSEKWTNREAWEKLEKGMTEQQVVQLLGKPKQEIRRGGMKWYYQEAPRKNRAEPTHGFVRFLQTEKSSIVLWYLYDWQEPNWKKVEAEMKEAESK